MTKDIYGAIEFGGTKTVALIAQGKNNILSKRVFHTLAPLQTIQALVDYFKNYQSSNNLLLKSIGISDVLAHWTSMLIPRRMAQLLLLPKKVGRISE